MGNLARVRTFARPPSPGPLYPQIELGFGLICHRTPTPVSDGSGWGLAWVYCVLVISFEKKIRVRGKGLVGVVRLGNDALFDVPHLRDGHGLNPSMGWVGSHFPAHVMGWVGLS